MAHVVVRAVGFHAQIPAFVRTAGRNDLAVNRRENTQTVPLFFNVPARPVGFHLRAHGRQSDRIRLADETRAKIIQADGDAAVRLRFRPRMAAMIETVERHVQPENVRFLLPACRHFHRRRLGYELRMGGASPAVEMIVAGAMLKLAGQLVPANAGRRRQIFKIRFPKNLFLFVGFEIFTRFETGFGDSAKDDHHHRKEKAQEDDVSGIPVKAIYPGEHDESPLMIP
ncbi:MAG: hypothetical protein ILNGONEN_02161 [Syntrophorhabdaceae bacterium]|nr:hypothetical protein [Syntrophorhabdaceae bacterium]